MRLHRFVLQLLLLLSMAWGTAQASSGWTVLKDGRGINDVVWTGTRYIALGAGGRVLTSENGSDWHGAQVTNENLKTVVWTGSKAFAFGDSSVFVSADGLAWSSATIVASKRPTNPVWNGNRFVALGPNKKLLGSKDGLVWDSVAVCSRYLRNLQWLDSVFVADTDDSLFMVSPDGLAWSTVVATGQELTRLGKSSDGFVAMGSGRKFLRSTDLKSWTEFGTPLSSEYWSPTWTGDGFVAIHGGYSDLVTRSDRDGKNWTVSSTGGVSVTNVLRRQPGRILGIGSGGTLVESTDSARSWKVLQSWRGNHLLDIDWNGTWLSVTGMGSTGIESKDGVHWNELTNRDDMTGAWRCFSASSTTRRIHYEDLTARLTTTDLVTGATTRDTTRRYGLYGATWTGSQFVVVGDSGQILTSPDGIAWSLRNAESGVLLTEIQHDGPLLVAAGDGPNIYTSPDGIAWTKRPLGASYNIRGLAWTGTKYVAVGFNQTALTSPDGITWTSRPRPTSKTLYGMVWTGTELVGVGAGGVVASSPDGLSWKIDTTLSADLFSVAWTGKALVAVGGNGLIVSSGTLPTAVGIETAEHRPSQDMRLEGSLLRVPDGTRSVRFLSIDGRVHATALPEGLPGRLQVALPSLPAGVWIASPTGSNASPVRFVR